VDLPAMLRIALQAGKWHYNIMFYFTYVLKSKLDNKLYVGWTTNLKERLQRHAKGLVFATKGRRPLELVYYEAVNNKESAVNREKDLKTGYGRAYLKKRLSG
jgi:putative endonuclease